MLAGNELKLTLKDVPIQVFDRTQFKWILPRKNPGFEQLVNQLGVLATKNKGMKKPITTMNKFIESNDDNQKLYISWENDPSGVVVHGFIKTSRKKLYLRDKNEIPYIESPVCFMDHYFFDGNLEKTIELIDFILQKEGTTISKCAFDNPSKDLTTLLESHYGLECPVPQSIYFVVYKSFFDGLNSTDQTEHVLASKSTSSRASLSPFSHKAADQVSDLIHVSSHLEPAKRAAPDTPQGRKFTRDFGHQSIW